MKTAINRTILLKLGLGYTSTNSSERIILTYNKLSFDTFYSLLVIEDTVIEDRQ